MKAHKAVLVFGSWVVKHSISNAPLIFKDRLFYPPSSEIAPCFGTAGTVHDAYTWQGPAY